MDELTLVDPPAATAILVKPADEERVEGGSVMGAGRK